MTRKVKSSSSKLGILFSFKSSRPESIEAPPSSEAISRFSVISENFRIFLDGLISGKIIAYKNRYLFFALIR